MNPELFVSNPCSVLKMMNAKLSQMQMIYYFPVCIAKTYSCANFDFYFILLIIRVIATNCFELNPSWMWKDRDVIGDIPLRKLMIPGTHNSGSYITTNVSLPFMIEQIETLYFMFDPKLNELCTSKDLLRHTSVRSQISGVLEGW